MIWRGYMEYTYWTCMRCQQKYPIEQMRWELGLLVCEPRCSDRNLLGSVELAQAREISRDRQELTPNQKLITPVDPASQIEQLPASSGIY